MLRQRASNVYSYRSVDKDLCDPERGWEEDDDTATAGWTIKDETVEGGHGMSSLEEWLAGSVCLQSPGDREDAELALHGGDSGKRKQTCRIRNERYRRQYAGLKNVEWRMRGVSES